MSFWRISVTQLSFAIGLDTSQVPAEAAKAGAEAGKQLKSSFEQNVAKLKMPQLEFKVDQKGNGLKVVGEALRATEEQAKKTAGTLKGKLGGAVKSITGFFSKLGETLKGQVGQFALVQTAANLLTAALLAIVKGIGAFVQQAAKMEVLVLQLEAFIGSAQGAADAYDEFRAVAEKTPFNVAEVAEAGKIMLGFGVEAGRAVESTKQLAIVASAVGGDMNNLARNLGQVSAQQRAYTRDLTQFAIQGIPIWQELSKATGRSVVDLKEMATKGKIGMDEVTVALTNMTAAGSAFANISDEMEGTLIGKMQKLASTITDAALNLSKMIEAIDETTGLVSGFVAIFQAGLDLINGGIVFVTENMRTLTTAVVALTTFSGALFAIMNFSAIVTGIKAVIGVVKGWNLITKAQIVLQVLVQALAGNYIAIAAAIGIAATVALSLNVALDAQIDKQKELAEIKKDQTEETKKQQIAEAEKAKTQEGLNGLITEGNAELARLRETERENEGLTEEQKKDYDELAAKVRVWSKTYDELYGKVAQVNAEIKKAKRLEEAAVDAAKRRTEEVRDQKREVDRAREAVREALDDEKRVRDRLREDEKNGLKDQKTARDNARDAVIEGLDDEKKAFDRNHGNQMKSIDSAKKAVEDNSEAAVNALDETHEKAIDAIEDEMSALDGKKQKVDSVYEAQAANIDNLKDREEDRHEKAMANIDSQLDAIDNSIDQQKSMTDQLKSAEKARHEGAMDNLDRQKDAAKRNYDAQIAQLDAVKARNLDALNALTPAEKELRNIRIAGLKATASDGSATRKERLEAQATLDDMKRQQTIGKVLKADTAERDRLGGNLKATQDAINDKVEGEKAAHERNMGAIESQDKAKIAAFEADKLRLEEMKGMETTDHEAKMTRLDDKETRAGEVKDAAIANIEAEEKALQDNETDVKKRHEDAVDRVETERLAKVAALDSEKEKLDEMKTVYEEDLADKLERISDEETAAGLAYDAAIKRISDRAIAEDRAHEDRLEEISDEETASDDYFEDILESISDIRTAENDAHKVKMIELKEAGDEAIAQNKRVAEAAKKQQKDLKVKKPGNGERELSDMTYADFGSGFLASGGPTSGGSTYTVNELGQESFLSASGKLSMIKAPSWGKWKAPGKGTVIPAHLTSQMSIPSGGVKVGGGAHSNSMKAAQGGGMNRLVSAIRNAAGGGGNYNNQVTIQSTNPNQTASDMLVSLNRIKRRRYS